MKKAVFVLAALAVMLFTSCSGLFDDGTVKKSAGISCTIDAASLAQLPGARAASSSFTIALTMNNSSTGAAIQSVSTTCAPGGTCTLSFDPVATGTKVVFTGTIAYNGTAIATVSSKEYTIIEGANTVTVTITPSYSVSVSVDLSSYKISDSGTITLTLKNNSDSTTQTKTVTGALNTAQTVTFDTAIATGTSVTVGGYVTYNSEDAYDFTDKTFTVSSATGTVSLSGSGTERFRYTGDGYGNFSGKVYYGLASTEVFSDQSAKTFATAFSPAGQVYVVSYNSTTKSYLLFTNGTSYTVSGITDANIPSATSLSYIPDSSGKLLLCLEASFYLLTPASDSYTASSVSTAILSLPATATITSIAVASVENNPCVFYTYGTVSTDASDQSKDSNKLYLNVAALMSYTTLAPLGGAEFPVSALSSTDTSAFRSTASFTDMIVNNGKLYLLLSDAPSSAFQFSEYFGLSSRGALVYADIAAAIISIKANKAPSFTAKGWCSTAQTIYSDSKQGKFYGTATNDYTENCFAGARMFVALKPEAITMADYGVYVASAGSSGAGGYCKEKNGIAVFDISNAALSFTALNSADPDCIYGDYGSGFEMGRYFEYSACAF